MWGLFYSSDFNKLMFIFIGDAFGFVAFMVFWGLEGSLVLFFGILSLTTVYFVMKSFWPEKHLENIIRFKNEPQHYFPGPEPSELEP